MIVQGKSILGLLIILCVAVLAFLPGLEGEFVNWDEPAYIQKNHLIKDLSLAGVQQIFTTFVNSNYQPLSILSFAIEYHFFGLNPKVFHLTNLILHLCNIIFVFWFIHLLARDGFVALIVAMLFAIHPMRVESVVWITERKDVLFLFFYMMALIGYLRGQQKSGIDMAHYLGSLIFFILAALAKPSAVSLPVTLLLIDYAIGKKMLVKKNVYPKVPFFIISLVFGGIAMLGTYTPDVDIVSIGETWKNAFMNLRYPHMDQFHVIDRLFIVGFVLVVYMAKLFWVVGLSCFYPYPTKINGLLPLHYYFVPLIFIGIVYLIYVARAKKRVYVFGFIFFISTIFFNLPLRNVGHVPMMGDRFTYLPYIGLFFIIAHFISEKIYKLNINLRRRFLLGVVAVGVIGFLSFQTSQRTKVWKNSETLWTDVIVQYPNEPVPFYNRGTYYLENGFAERAIKDFSIAISLNPKHVSAHINRGVAYSKIKEYKKAIFDYNTAIILNPHLVQAYLNRALCYLKFKDLKRALLDCERIIVLSPNHQEARRLRDRIYKLL